MDYFETHIESDPFTLVLEWQLATYPESDPPHLCGAKLLYGDTPALSFSHDEVRKLLGRDMFVFEDQAWVTQLELVEENT